MGKVLTYKLTDQYIPTLMSFIDEQYIKQSQDLSRLAIVFGGKRPALFLKRELAKRFKKGFYPPQFFTIDEFINTIIYKNGLFKSSDDLDSCYLMYNLVKQHTPHILEGREKFAQFLPWTREILKFIDHLDLECMDESRLTNIKDNAEIGYDVPEDINKLLGSMVTLRRVYHEALEKESVLSGGLQYLTAAEKVSQTQFDEFDQILFCNFFYFNKCEEKIIGNLHERGLVTAIFQGDQRKWPVLERIGKALDSSIEEGPEVVPPQYNLKLYSGFDGHAQVCLARDILKGIKNLEDTVIVLPTPDHIIPLLSEIATLVKDFNISMGYPLKRSSLYSLLDFIFQAQLSKKEGRYYAKDYLKALRHPFVKNLNLTGRMTETRILIHKIEEVLTGRIPSSISGSLFFNLEDIESLDELFMATGELLERMGLDVDQTKLQIILQTIHEVVFNSWSQVHTFEHFAQALGEFLDLMVSKSFLKNFPLNINIATKMYELKDELTDLSFKSEEFPREEIFRIFDSKVSREIVAFVGSPLKGLQVLGLFETRSLNFENVIILDVNEGVLPHLNVYEPLIPREVMISLSLDRLELEEEIQRYQFMRLISSAKNVHLVYQESRDKQRSRFVEELLWEEEKKKNEMNVIPLTRGSFRVKIKFQQKSVQKTPDIIETLKSHRFSASSLNTYLRDPFEFYYKYVLNIREQDDLLDEPEARQVGTFIHEVLESGFQPYLNKKPVINNQFRHRLMDEFETKFSQTFGRSMKSDAFLLKSVLVERLNRFLDHEQFNRERDITKLLYLENYFEDTISLSCGDIQFAYIFDRIEELKDGTIMIIDYKTGSTSQMPKGMDRISQMELSRKSIRDNVVSFQIPLYYHYLNKQFPDKPINAALYNLRTVQLQKFIDKKTSFSRHQINTTFLNSVDYVISEILDPEIDFISSE